MANSTGTPPERTPEAGHADGPVRDPLVRRALVILLLVLLAGATALLVLWGIGVLLAAFAGVLLAIFLRALVDLVKRGLPVSDGAALTIVLVLLTGGLAIGGWLLAPQVSDQADELAERIPEITGEIQDYLEERLWGQWVLGQAGMSSRTPDAAAGESADPDGSAGGNDDSDAALSGLPDTAPPMGGLLGAASTWSTYFLTALFVGLFAAANPPLYTNGFANLFPLRHRPRILEVLERLGYTLRRWLIGQLLTMVLIGVSTMIVLWAFGVPLAIILGLIVGLLGFIPYLGPILGLVPVVLIAATQDVTTLAYVVLAYTGVQMLEGYVANPLIHQGTVHLPPASTVAFQMLMGAVVGVIGIVLATPLAAVLLVLMQFYRRDVLGDTEADTG